MVDTVTVLYLPKSLVCLVIITCTKREGLTHLVSVRGCKQTFFLPVEGGSTSAGFMVVTGFCPLFTRAWSNMKVTFESAEPCR